MIADYDDMMIRWGRNKDRNSSHERPVSFQPLFGITSHVAWRHEKHAPSPKHFPKPSDTFSPRNRYNQSVMIKFSYSHASSRVAVSDNTSSAIHYAYKNDDSKGYSSKSSQCTKEEALSMMDGKKIFKVSLSVKNQEPSERYVRQVMHELEKIVGHDLLWIAADHYDTDHHHTHIIISREDGDPSLSFQTPLYISPQVISETLRQKATTIANRHYGYVYPIDIKREHKRAITASSVTTLDNVITRIEKASDVSGVAKVTKKELDTISSYQREYVQKRLEYLAKQNLITKSSEGYLLSKNWKNQLYDKQRLAPFADVLLNNINDTIIVKNTPLVDRKEISGRIIAKRVVDELHDRVGFIVQGTDGKNFYHEQILAYKQYKDLEIGDTVTIRWTGSKNYKYIAGQPSRYDIPKMSRIRSR